MAKGTLVAELQALLRRRAVERLVRDYDLEPSAAEAVRRLVDAGGEAVGLIAAEVQPREDARP